MIFAPLFALALTSVVAATPLKRFDGLTVAVTGPSEVSSVSDLKLTATVKNTGTEDVKILKYGTILDSETPTRSFTVTKDGAAVAFTGVKLTLSLTDDVYTTIPAGKEVTVTHDVSALYDFSAAGAGTFSFVPNTAFQAAGADEKVDNIGSLSKIQASSADLKVNVSGDLSKREIVPSKRATDTCTTSSYKSFIDAAYTEAKSLATIAANYITSNGASSLYTAYYKTNSQSSVKAKFTAVANESSSSRTLNCSDPYGVCDGNVIAYTVTSTTNIYFCSIFYNEVATSKLCSGTTVASRNIRGGTVLHELTHAVASTIDVTYGCSADQALSASNQLINADNYNCFSTAVYAATQC